MKVLKRLIPVLIALAVCVLLIVFKTTPSARLWDNYTVLYTENSVPDSLVQQALNSFGVQDYVCEANQGIPYVYKNEVLDKMTIRITEDFDDFSYLKKRNNYFYDKSGDFRLYYAPGSYKKNLADCAAYIETATALKAGIDTSSSYMRLLVIVFAVFALILTGFSKNKFLFICSWIIPAIYSFCFPFYGAVISACMLVLCTFLFCNLWKRSGSFKTLYKHFLIPALLTISVIMAFSSELISGLFYLLTILGSAAVIVIYYYIELLYEARCSFNPVMIRPAKMLSPYGGKKRGVLLAALISCAAVIIFFLITSAGNFSIKTSELELPASAAQRDTTLPQLDDYYRWNWNVETYPYRSLNKADEASDYVAYPRYAYSDGKIIQYMDELIYDEDYKKNVLNDVDSLDFESIEKVIKSQSGNFVAGYMTSGTYQVHFISIISMIVCFIMLLFLYISAMIRKGGKK